MKFQLLLLISIFLKVFCNGQDFKKSIDKDFNIRIVEFVDNRTPTLVPIIVRKTIYLDSTSTNLNSIEIGLYLILNSIQINFFMQKGAIIKFVDNSSILFKENISTVYLYSGNHQAFLIHKLSQSELLQLQSKKIKSFNLAGHEKIITNWGQDELINIFTKIERE